MVKSFTLVSFAEDVTQPPFIDVVTRNGYYTVFHHSILSVMSKYCYLPGIHIMDPCRVISYSTGQEVNIYIYVHITVTVANSSPLRIELHMVRYQRVLYTGMLHRASHAYR